jgi:ribonuclease HII
MVVNARPEDRLKDTPNQGPERPIVARASRPCVARATQRFSAFIWIAPRHFHCVARLDAKSTIDRFEFERALLRRGVNRIAGVDEAGRGPLAGPVVAAAVQFPSRWISDGLPRELDGINDSKQLSAEQRETYYAFLTANEAVRFAIGQLDAGLIDAINILQATHGAMSQALDGLRPEPKHVLVDGLRVKSIRFPQTPLVKGDARSFSIAAASILAKVTRDRLMLEYDRQFPFYGFAEHKGYGTAQHLAALARHGPCPIHRRSFAPLKPVQGELF